jgi:ribA/ribD-fused uncharacterized protein
MKYCNNWLIDLYEQQSKLEFLFFWGHQPNRDGSLSKSCLSQWWVSPFEVDGIVYKTAEHWMMAGKARLFNDHNIAKQIIETDSPAEIKKKGRLVAGFEPATWNKEKFNIVVAGNFHKFSGNKALSEFLLNTADSVLVEASPVDSIWGIGMAENDPSINNPPQWKGENLLGYALMEVRDKLRQAIDL